MNKREFVKEVVEDLTEKFQKTIDDDRTDQMIDDPKCRKMVKIAMAVGATLINITIKEVDALNKISKSDASLTVNHAYPLMFMAIMQAVANIMDTEM